MSRLLLLLLPSLLSAGPPASVADWIRAGDAAYARQDYSAAVDWYTRAEGETDDPGLVAGNRAAALMRLQRYREAELDYRRALQDGGNSVERSARLRYDLGTAIMRQMTTPDLVRLRAAIGCFEQAVELLPTDSPLRADARHNLELARLLWYDAWVKAGRQPIPDEEPPANTETSNPRSPQTPKSPQAERRPDADGTSRTPGTKIEPIPGAGGGNDPAREAVRQAPPGAGSLPALDDQDTPQPLPEADTKAYLRNIEERFRENRRSAIDQRKAQRPRHLPYW